MMTRCVSKHVGAIKWIKCFSDLIIYTQVHKLVYENDWIIEMHGATIKVTKVSFESHINVSISVLIASFDTCAIELHVCHKCVERCLCTSAPNTIYWAVATGRHWQVQRICSYSSSSEWRVGLQHLPSRHFTHKKKKIFQNKNFYTHIFNLRDSIAQKQK
jgi:hypothetical protein